MFKILVLICFAALTNGEIAEKLKLSSGHDIPVVGLGTGSIKPDEFDRVIASALENKYRHFDTAYLYKNENLLGQALKKWLDQGGKREDLFITSKLPPYGNQPQSVEKYLNLTLKDLGLDYIDMYLIHVPWRVREEDNFSLFQNSDGIKKYHDVDHVAVWKEMEKQVKAGRARSIGLSNFDQNQIQKIYESAEIKPANLQDESHAYSQQRKLRDFCKQKKIILTAYAPLGSNERRKKLQTGTEKDLPSLLETPIIKELALKYKKTPAQILLRHSIQDGLVVIPKTSNPTRLKENIGLFDFELSADDVKKIDSLDMGEKGRVF